MLKKIILKQCLKQFYQYGHPNRMKEDILQYQKIGITIEDIRMAVLCQKIIPVAYVYVILSKNSTTNNENEFFVEMVSGKRKTLVCDYDRKSFYFVFY